MIAKFTFILLFFVAQLFLYGCFSPARTAKPRLTPDERLSPLVGESVDVLIRKAGPPHSSYKLSNGNDFIEYKYTSYNKSPVYSSSYPTSNQTIYNSGVTKNGKYVPGTSYSTPPQYNTYTYGGNVTKTECILRFEISDSIIMSYQHIGCD
jgi:hypothetical protein